MIRHRQYRYTDRGLVKAQTQAVQIHRQRSNQRSDTGSTDTQTEKIWSKIRHRLYRYTDRDLVKDQTQAVQIHRQRSGQRSDTSSTDTQTEI